jgi:hypothetical protein
MPTDTTVINSNSPCYQGEGFSRLDNVTVVGFYYLFNCYMFRSNDRLQAEVYLLDNYSSNNGSVVFRILVNFMDNYSDQFD